MFRCMRSTGIAAIGVLVVEIEDNAGGGCRCWRRGRRFGLIFIAATTATTTAAPAARTRTVVLSLGVVRNRRRSGYRYIVDVVHTRNRRWFWRTLGRGQGG